MKIAGGHGVALFMALAASACQHLGRAPEQYPALSAPTNSVLGVWELVSVDGLAVRPKAVNITFNSTGAFTAMVDCNTARGHYSFTGAQLSFVGWTATERGCEGPLEHERVIEEALRGDGYAVLFKSSSELHLSGPHEMVLRRV